MINGSTNTNNNYLNSTFCMNDSGVKIQVPMRSNMTWKSYIDYIKNNYNSLDKFNYYIHAVCNDTNCYYDENNMNTYKDNPSYKSYYYISYDDNIIAREVREGWKVFYEFEAEGEVTDIKDIDLENTIIQDSSHGCYQWGEME